MKLLFWLPSRFAVSAELQGDIAEDYAELHSLLRLARQSAFAIASTVAADLWRDKPCLLGTAGAGWVLIPPGLKLL